MGVSTEHLVLVAGGVSHVRHPMWTRLAYCGAKLDGFRRVRSAPLTCPWCRKRLAPAAVARLDADAATNYLRATTAAQVARAELGITAVDPLEAAAKRARERVLEREAAEEPEIIDVLCGACGSYDAHRVRGDDPVRRALSLLVCQRCGARGRFTLAARPLSDPVERPPHPEEP